MQLRQVASEVVARHGAESAVAAGKADITLSADELHERYLTAAKRCLNRRE